MCLPKYFTMDLSLITSLKMSGKIKKYSYNKEMSHTVLILCKADERHNTSLKITQNVLFLTISISVTF